MKENINNKKITEVNTDVNKKRPPQAVIDKMNKAIVAAEETSMTPAELEDSIYREMFGADD